MKRFTPACLAVASAFIGALDATMPRPRYGGTLRLETAAALNAINPSVSSAETADAAARDRIRALVFETLVTSEREGGIRPVLATSWETDGRAARWRFTIRRGVRLHDGSTLTPQDVADALTDPGHRWKVTATSDQVAIDADRPMPEMLWELADMRHPIRVRRGDTTLGSGPFAVDRIEADKRLTLRAHEDYWAGRPFVDAVRIETGRRPADQLTDLELARADIVSVGPQDARRLRQRGLALAASMPVELIALVRQPNSIRPLDDRTRRALSLAIDRRAMTDVLLQRLAEPAATVLPQWLTGYTGLFGLAHDRAAARSIVSALPPDRRTLSVRFESSDPLIRSLAERIVLDAREAGLAVTLDPAQPPSLRPIDFRIVRVKLDTMLPDRAASRVQVVVHAQLRRLVTVEPDPGASLEAISGFERALIDQYIVIPLVHVPEVYGIGANVESSTGSIVLPSFALDLANVWLRSAP